MRDVCTLVGRWLRELPTTVLAGQERRCARAPGIDRVAGAQNVATLPPQGLRTPVATGGGVPSVEMPS